MPKNASTQNFHVTILVVLTLGKQYFISLKMVAPAVAPQRGNNHSWGFKFLRVCTFPGASPRQIVYVIDTYTVTQGVDFFISLFSIIL